MMKINIDDVEIVKYVKAVKVNGEYVKTAQALDTTEGWVDIAIPNMVKEQSFKSGGNFVDNNNEQTELSWQQKRIHGNVEVIWHENTPAHIRLPEER